MAKAKKEKIIPIPQYVKKENTSQPVERLHLKFKREELEKLRMAGRFHLPLYMIREGGHCLEFAEVLGVSGGEKQIKVGDTVAVSYSLVMIDIGKHDEDLRHADWIEKDEDGNEYAMPFITQWNVFGIIKDDNIEPLDGVVFCEVPKIETPDKIGSIFVPDTAKKIDTHRKSFKTKILFISKNDKKALGLQVGDTIFCKKDSDIPIKINDKNYIRVPADRILCKIK